MKGILILNDLKSLMKTSKSLSLIPENILTPYHNYQFQLKINFNCQLINIWLKIILIFCIIIKSKYELKIILKYLEFRI